MDHTLRNQAVLPPFLRGDNYVPPAEPKPYEYQEFPKAMYKQGPNGVIHVTVKSPQEEAALGEGWFDNPDLKAKL